MGPVGRAAQTLAQTDADTDAGDGHSWALRTLQHGLSGSGLPTPQAIAHRIVHGGADYDHSTVLDETALQRLQALAPLAPLHQPHNLRGVQLLSQAYPGVLQVGCFDTAYHRSIPPLHSQWALPAAVRALGVQRYGFHGLSYQYIVHALGQVSARAGARVLMAHLGNGASLCAARQGRSLATTMGFSALDGLVMGTRCGSIDPGVLLFLLARGWSAAELEDLLYRQSGLLGASGLSADMRSLRASDSAAAHEAIALFTRQLLHEAGGMVAALQGLDVLSFSGGIGEHDAALRAEVCRQLDWLGLVLDEEANARADGQRVQALHAAHSRVEVWLVPTDEGVVAAQEAARIVRELHAKNGPSPHVQMASSS
jgi:acetate kinase